MVHNKLRIHQKTQSSQMSVLQICEKRSYLIPFPASKEIVSKSNDKSVLAFLFLLGRCHVNGKSFGYGEHYISEDCRVRCKCGPFFSSCRPLCETNIPKCPSGTNLVTSNQPIVHEPRCTCQKYTCMNLGEYLVRAE